MGGSWSQLSTGTDNAQPSGYTDPIWSNVGAGFRIVGGRATALANDGSTIYAGFADGGVWKTTDAGKLWTPVFDNEPSLSIGSIAVNPADHSLWVGTGEANTNSRFLWRPGCLPVHQRRRIVVIRRWQRHFSRFTSFRLVFDGYGTVYAATNNGLYRRSASDTHSPGRWSSSPTRTRPTSRTNLVHHRRGRSCRALTVPRCWPPTDGAAKAIPLPTPRTTAFTSPPTWRGPEPSTEITPTVHIDASDIGRHHFAYSATAVELYAMIDAECSPGRDVNLQGIFVSANGNPAGP